MIIWVCLILGLICFRSTFTKKGISEAYISKDNSNAVRGVFILLILASHFSKYVGSYTAPLDTAYWTVRVYLGQCVVCMFFFYSGYGVTLSFMEKGETYRRQFLSRRLLQTLLVYDLSEVIFFILQRELGKTYSVKAYLQSMLAWTSFGNDNWYIFAILCLYLIAWIARSMSNTPRRYVGLLWVGTLVFAQLLICAGKKAFWYNTAFCFPLGALWYFVKSKCESWLDRDVRFLFTFLLTAAAYVGAHSLWRRHVSLYTLTALLFTLVVLMITMKIQFKSRILIYAGKHLQELFLVHRLPMILLGRIPQIKQNVHLYFALSVLAAFLTAFLFGKLLQLLRAAYKGDLKSRSGA